MITRQSNGYMIVTLTSDEGTVSSRVCEASSSPRGALLSRLDVVSSQFTLEASSPGVRRRINIGAERPQFSPSPSRDPIVFVAIVNWSIGGWTSAFSDRFKASTIGVRYSTHALACVASAMETTSECVVASQSGGVAGSTGGVSRSGACKPGGFLSTTGESSSSEFSVSTVKSWINLLRSFSHFQPLCVASDILTSTDAPTEFKLSSVSSRSTTSWESLSNLWKLEASLSHDDWSSTKNAT